MRILLLTTRFLPTSGGIQTVVKLLCHALQEIGHDVGIATLTVGHDPIDDTLSVARNPSQFQIFAQYRWAEAIIIHGPSVRLGWPLLFLRRPAIVVHHIWRRELTIRHAFSVLAERAIYRSTLTLAVSKVLAESLPHAQGTLPNPYESDQFHSRIRITRNRDLLFVGRLIPEKGCDLLLDAVKLLQDLGKGYSVTIVGDGPQKPALENQARMLPDPSAISFAGDVKGADLAELYRSHRATVVPSRWVEPFGIVPLEAMASGSQVVAARHGGLLESCAACAHYFTPSSDESLAAVVLRVLEGEVEPISPSVIEAHLEKHLPRRVALAYLERIQPLARP